MSDKNSAELYCSLYSVDVASWKCEGKDFDEVCMHGSMATAACATVMQLGGRFEFWDLRFLEYVGLREDLHARYKHTMN